MGEATKIEWTHHTFNTWWGCTRVSPGCEHCYAESFARRTGLGWGVAAERRFFGEKHWAEPLKWNAAAAKAGERRRVFCSSMADVFEDRDELPAWRTKLWSLIDATPALDWLLLTKRPQNMRRMLPATWLDEPRANVWLGTTCEDQKRADERIPHLMDAPAVVRFLSCEPLLGPVDLTDRLGQYGRCPDCGPVDHVDEDGCCLMCGADAVHHGVDWVIVGGESGPGARAMSTAWARVLVHECRAAGVACFVKQLGARPMSNPSQTETLIRLRDRKGGDINEFPADLRVREFPEHAHV